MFDKVFGHERVKKILERMVAGRNLHHGMLFYGPSGIGKRLLGIQLARAMLCEHGTGCGQCKHCHKFESGNHPDFKAMGPDGNDIKVDQIREITENLHFKPFEAKARIILIDQVERFREESANAFLKSLEEPPEYVYFILITSDLDALLPTIKSRCQKIAFQSLLREDKTNILKTHFRLPTEMAERLAGISFRQLETDPEAWDFFRTDVEEVLKFLEMMVNAGHAIDFFGDRLRDKATMPRFNDHLIATVRELTLMSFQVPGNNSFDPFRDRMNELVGRCEGGQWRSFWEELTRLAGKRRMNLNQPLWFNATSVNALGLREQAEAMVRSRLGR